MNAFSSLRLEKPPILYSAKGSTERGSGLSEESRKQPIGLARYSNSYCHDHSAKCAFETPTWREQARLRYLWPGSEGVHRTARNPHRHSDV